MKTLFFLFLTIFSSCANPPLKIDELSKESDAFSIVVIPDTQVVIDKNPEVWMKQTQWILDNQDHLSLKFVLQLGDITDNDTQREWENAKKGFSTIHGKIPYSLTVGNHDLPGNSAVRDTALFNEHFKVSEFSSLPTFGGVYEPDHYENNFHLFDAGGVKWLVLMLEFGPRREVVTWANSVIEKFRDRKVIIATHCYLDPYNRRVDYKDPAQEPSWNPHNYGLGKSGNALDGEELWTDLVSKHPNVLFVLSGHVLDDGAGYLKSTGIYGNEVHQIVSNYQYYSEKGGDGHIDGGDGYLRVMQFYPRQHRLKVITYSPYTNHYMATDYSQNNFEIEVDIKK